ncbi:hypothetical protein HK405_012847 [Cladochytrium tenue]|nr:hypothetical protein HK405_012847 [Cladochytrium tenue]
MPDDSMPDDTTIRVAVTGINTGKLAEVVHDLRTSLSHVVKLNFTDTVNTCDVYLELSDDAFVDETLAKLAEKNYKCSRVPRSPDDLGALMQRYYGFEKFIPSTKAAEFSDAFSASIALEDLLKSTNIGASFKDLTETTPDLEGSFLEEITASFQPALEADSKHVFIRVTPPGLSLEDTEGLLGRSGYLVKLVNSGPRFAKATFVDEVIAGKALEFVRNNTNLVANFFRFNDRYYPNEQDYEGAGKRQTVYKKSSFTHINPRGFIPRPATPDFGSTGYPEAAPAAIPDATLRRSNSMGAKEPPSHKEWPGVRLTTACLGSLMLNPLVLFGREPGFLRLLLENDQSCVALFETEAEAAIAASHLSRLILKPRSVDGPGPVSQVNRTMPHINKGRDSDPTDVVRVSLEDGVDEKLVELLVATSDGFQKCSKDRMGGIIAQFSSISRAKKALEELRTNTNLTADFADNLTSSRKPADVAGHGASESDNWSTSRHGHRRESFNQPHSAGGGSWRGGYRESHSYRGNNGDEYGHVGGGSGWNRRGQGYRGGGRGRGGGFHKPITPEPRLEVNIE